MYVAVVAGLERVAGLDAAGHRVDGLLLLRLHLLLQLLDLLGLGRPLPVWLARNVGLVRLLAGHSQVAHVALNWRGLRIQQNIMF